MGCEVHQRHHPPICQLVTWRWHQPHQPPPCPVTGAWVTVTATAGEADATKAAVSEGANDAV